jgi:hypothetical protein
MSENMTNTVGFKNPHTHSVYIEISDLNIKVELPPGKFIMDMQGNLLNDPVFEAYCHQKGLSRVTSDQPVPLRLVPRMAKAINRPTSAVTEASSFVRNQATGTVQPVYKPAQQAEPPPMNKNPIVGMSVEKARKLGLIGKPRLVPEDYGADETTGAPERGKKLPDIKISIESPPRIRTAAPLRPELLESSEEDLPPAEIARRSQLQSSMAQAAAVPHEQFDPARIRPLVNRAPVPLKATDEPVGIVGATQMTPVHPQPEQEEELEPAPEPVKAAPRPISTKRPVAPAPPAPKRTRTVVIEEQPAQEPAQAVERIEAQAEETTVEAPATIQPLDEAGSGPISEQEGQFVCAADGKPFKFRSELDRYVRRKFPHMAEQLMQPYPPA